LIVYRVRAQGEKLVLYRKDKPPREIAAAEGVDISYLWRGNGSGGDKP
jgi:hypothetical protein